jgi:hypothetical protein
MSVTPACGAKRLRTKICADQSAVAILATAFGVFGAVFELTPLSSLFPQGEKEERPRALSGRF